MSRKNPNWLEYNGHRSSEYDAVIRDAHNFSTGAARGTQEAVSGKSGYLWISDNTREAFDIKQTLTIPASRLREVTLWLTGMGSLRFSNREDIVYEARIIKKVDFRRSIPGTDPGYDVTVTFNCQPYAHIYPTAEDISVTESGTSLVNPGNAPALPRLKITGSGTFSLTIGMQTMFFRGVQDGIIIDSELQDALTYDGALLANDRISGDFFEIQPGTNVVQWLLGGEGLDGEDAPGSITEIVITPRWRCL